MVKVKLMGTLFALLFVCTLAAQTRFPIGFAYWDVGRCYDTIPSNFYNDKNFTPKGRYRWNTERYNRKIRNVAAVIDSLHMPIVALSGVETEDVVRDIVVACKGDYSYVHRTLDSRDGLDFALLYYGDMFFVDRVQDFYERLYIEGTIDQKRVGIWLTKSGYFQKSASPPHRDSVDIMVVAGGFYRGDLQNLGLKDYMADFERRGFGNAKSTIGWYMRHRIGIDESVRTIGEGVFVDRWLLNDDRSAPLSTFSSSGRWYLGGYSSYLPVYLYFLIY
ncbi:MAG: hypothetical protein SNG27_06120 [Rikenellaceae bacterium]